MELLIKVNVPEIPKCTKGKRKILARGCHYAGFLKMDFDYSN